MCVSSISWRARTVAGYETYAAQIAHILADQPEVKVSVLECLFHVASADGVLHPDEDRYLAHVAEIFGLTKGEFRCVRRGFVFDADSPYEVLHISPVASDKDIKARYRELVKGHHPDALVSKGVPPEFLAGAGAQACRHHVRIRGHPRRARPARRKSAGTHSVTFTPDTPLAHAVHPAHNREPRRGGGKPSLLILHYTGMSSAAKAIDWLARSESGVSCHYVIDEARADYATRAGRAARVACRHFLLARRDGRQFAFHRHRDPQPGTSTRLSGISRRANARPHRALERYRPPASHRARQRPGALRRGARTQDRSGGEVQLAAARQGGSRPLGASAARSRRRSGPWTWQRGGRACSPRKKILPPTDTRSKRPVTLDAGD